MTHRPLHSPRLRRSAFTLTELLVIIGILGLLVTLVTIGITRAKRSALTSRVKADFQAISMALEAFKQDHGAYPGLKRIPAVPGQTASPDTFLAWRHNTLALCLLGPGDAGTSDDGLSAPPASAPYRDASTGFIFDGARGPGFRTSYGGKIWSPYLAPEKFRVVHSPGRDGVINTADDTMDLLDAFGGPIQYYPRRGIATANRGVPSLVAPVNTAPTDTTATAQYQFDARDGVLTAQELQLALGDSDMQAPDLDNQISGNEQLAFDGPFFLASLGEDLRPLDTASIGKGYYRKVFEARTGRTIVADSSGSKQMLNDNVYSFDP